MILDVLPSECFVFVDESGIEDNACVLRGWSRKGERCFGVKTPSSKRRVNMIAGLGHKGLIAPFLFEGSCNGGVFETYLEEVLLKQLRPGQMVVLDNIRFHKSARVHALIQSVGCRVLYLPTYSPDMNPIEHWWFKIKNHIRKVARRFTDFFEAVAFTLKDVSTQSV